jgi:vacuolar-type H+-ATPase subunit I/STV1
MRKSPEKKLTDFPEYSEVLEQFQGVVTRLTRVQERKEEIRTRPRSIDAESAWEQAKGTLVGIDSAKIDSPVSLGEEFSSLEREESVLTKALEAGRHELDTVRGRCSLEICQSAVRPRFVAQVRRILESLREISSANEELERIRAELERDGIATGSLASAIFNLGGSWDDIYGGKVVGYQRFIAENFPELANEAKTARRSKKIESTQEGVSR